MKEKSITNPVVEQALSLYNIPKKYVFHCHVDAESGEAMIVTHGGKKLRHRMGEKAKCELSETQITGKLPEQDLVWSEKYNQKIDLLPLLKKRQKG